jgi:5'-3' exonuclease
MAARAAEAGHQVAIVSIDKDFFQLVRDGSIRVYDPREDGAWFDEQGVLEKFGVQPSQVVDVLALVGDTSDNVAGVPGIGKKGAIDLITQFGSLDGLLARTAELKPKQREALESNREQALLWRKLTTIALDAPLHCDAFDRGAGDAAAIVTLCEDLRPGPLTRRRLQEAIGVQTNVTVAG